MITTSQQAFDTLDHYEEGIPYEAIAYLYELSPSDEIREKVLERLKYGFDEQLAAEVILWYAIVAEQYIGKKLIEPVLEVFRHPEYDNDILYEQASYLLTLLAKQFPDLVMEKVMPLLNKFDELTSHYIYLFEVFCFVDLKKHENRLLKTYKKAADLFAESLDEIILYRIRKGSLPAGMEKWLLKLCGKTTEQLEKAHADFVPLVERRESVSWQEYYQKREQWFKDMALDSLTFNESLLQDILDEAEQEAEEPIEPEELCPCMSGKKFKDCCGADR